MALEIPQFQGPDFVGPLATAMALHDRRENERTQRMFAENQMKRQSAQDLREQNKLKQDEEDRKRREGIEQAGALNTIQTTLRTNPGVAMAMGHAYGIDVHPLMASTQAAMPEQTAIDTSTQALPSGDAGELDPLGHGTPVEQQAPGPADADLEGLMRRASPSPGLSTGELDRELAGSREAAPSDATPTLYEAAIGPNKYKLNAKPVSAFGDPRYDQQVQRFVDGGMPLVEAQKLVLAQKEKNDSADAIAERTKLAIDQRGGLQQQRDEQFRMTPDQRAAENEKNRQNAVRVAQIRAASSGGTASPRDQESLAKLLHMAEGGATDGDIADAAANMHLNPKVWGGRVDAVDRKANADTRTADKRAGLEATDAEGNQIGGGTYKNAQAAAAGNKSEASFSQLDNRLKALIADVKTTGNRALTPDEIQRRNSLFASYAAAARVYNGLGGTDASQKLEAEIASARGTPGHGLLMGANPGVLDHLLQEARDQHVARQKINTRSKGSAPLPPAVTHRPAPDGSAPGKSNLTPAQQAALPSGWSIAE